MQLLLALLRITHHLRNLFKLVSRNESQNLLTSFTRFSNRKKVKTFSLLSQDFQSTRKSKPSYLCFYKVFRLKKSQPSFFFHQVFRLKESQNLLPSFTRCLDYEKVKTFSLLLQCFQTKKVKPPDPWRADADQ